MKIVERKSLDSKAAEERQVVLLKTLKTNRKEKKEAEEKNSKQNTKKDAKINPNISIIIIR